MSYIQQPSSFIPESDFPVLKQDHTNDIHFVICDKPFIFSIQLHSQLEPILNVCILFFIFKCNALHLSRINHMKFQDLFSNPQFDLQNVVATLPRVNSAMKFTYVARIIERRLCKNNALTLRI